jgi:hypothetical protein
MFLTFKVSEPKKRKQEEEGENYIMRSFIICSFHSILLLGLKYQGSDRREEMRKEWRTEVRKLQRKSKYQIC